MDLFKFLEARIDEQKAGIQGRSFAEHASARPGCDLIGIPPRLTAALLAECAMKRRILADWKAAAVADGIADPEDAEGPVALARRAMLLILAGGYKDHPDYQPEWELLNHANSYSEPPTGPTAIAKMPSHRAEMGSVRASPE